MPDSCRSLISSPVTTEIEIGTSRIDCSRFCAVTTISSTWAIATEGAPTIMRAVADFSSMFLTLFIVFLPQEISF